MSKREAEEEDDAAVAEAKRLQYDPPYVADRFTAKGATLEERYTHAIEHVLPAHGVAIIPGVLTEEEGMAMIDGAWRTAEYLSVNMPTPIVAGKTDTYATMNEFAPHHHGLVQHHRWGHAQYVWDVRQNERVAAFWAKLHKCDSKDLLVSLDGIHFNPGNGEFNYERKLHLDQGFGPDMVGQFKCVQGWVSPADVGEGEGTLRVLTGSHKLHKAFADRFKLTAKESPKQWFVVNRDTQVSEYLQWYLDQGCEDVCVKAPANSLVVWDSRTVHSGKESSKKEVRNVVYVCYMSRFAIPVKKLNTCLQKRRDIFDEASGDKFLRCCAHWPDAMRMFSLYPAQRPFKPRSALDEQWSIVPKIGMPKLTEFGKRVAGLV